MVIGQALRYSGRLRHPAHLEGAIAAGQQAFGRVENARAGGLGVTFSLGCCHVLSPQEWTKPSSLLN